MTCAAQTNIDGKKKITKIAIEKAAACLWDSKFDHPNVNKNKLFWYDLTSKEKTIYYDMAKKMFDAGGIIL